MSLLISPYLESLAGVDYIEPAAGEDEQKANDRFRKLVTLHIRTSLLSDIYATAGYSHGRASATLLQALLGHKPSTLADIGSLHRACIWENIVLKAALSARDASATPPPAPTPSVSAAQEPSASTAAGLPAAASSSAVVSANGAATADLPAPVSFVKKEEKPKDKNAAGLKHLVSQMPSALSPFFQCEYSRRLPEVFVS